MIEKKSIGRNTAMKTIKFFSFFFSMKILPYPQFLCGICLFVLKLVKKKKTRQVERDPVGLGETSNHFSLALHQYQSILNGMVQIICQSRNNRNDFIINMERLIKHTHQQQNDSRLLLASHDIYGRSIHLEVHHLLLMEDH